MSAGVHYHTRHLVGDDELLVLNDDPLCSSRLQPLKSQRADTHTSINLAAVLPSLATSIASFGIVGRWVHSIATADRP